MTSPSVGGPSDDDSPPCCFDDWAKTNADRARKGQTAPIVLAMLDQLQAAGFVDRTLLDIGCGSGDLALGAVERGAVRAHGIDLGSGSIDTARTLAHERGLQDRATFDVGDGATTELDAADVVALSRVVCCYADPRGLIDNAVHATRGVLAYSAPVDRGIAGVWNRVLVAVSNVWYAIRSSKFRGFRVF